MRYTEVLNNISKNGKKVFDRLMKYRTLVACIITALFFSLSLFSPSAKTSVEKEASKLEKKIRYRQQILEDYVQEAFATPVEQRLSLEDFPGYIRSILEHSRGRGS